MTPEQYKEILDSMQKNTEPIKKYIRVPYCINDNGDVAYYTAFNPEHPDNSRVKEK